MFIVFMPRHCDSNTQLYRISTTQVYRISTTQVYRITYTGNAPHSIRSNKRASITRVMNLGRCKPWIVVRSHEPWKMQTLQLFVHMMRLTRQARKWWSCEAPAFFHFGLAWGHLGSSGRHLGGQRGPSCAMLGPSRLGPKLFIIWHTCNTLSCASVSWKRHG